MSRRNFRQGVRVSIGIGEGSRRTADPSTARRDRSASLPPDFLWNLVALTDFMRLSLRERRTRDLVQCSVAGNPGRDDKGEGDHDSSRWDDKGEVSYTVSSFFLSDRAAPSKAARRAMVSQANQSPQRE
jgi:hypothetical protein